MAFVHILGNISYRLSTHIKKKGGPLGKGAPQRWKKFGKETGRNLGSNWLKELGNKPRRFSKGTLGVEQIWEELSVMEQF